MCGRTAQTYRAVSAAARSLGVPDGQIPGPPPSYDDVKDSAGMETEHDKHNLGASSSTTVDDSMLYSTSEHGERRQWHDNYNLSPGMTAYVMYLNNSQLCVDLKTWGLLSSNSSSSSSSPSSSSKNIAAHFSNRMFNARTDTLMEKPTFARLLHAGKTCVIAVDGFFEWKQQSSKNSKQPYFVHRKPYLLLAGLWTRMVKKVTAAKSGCEDNREKKEEVFDMFTILTTDVSDSLSWLHTRMPVVLDESMALQWLHGTPSSTTTTTTPSTRSIIMPQLIRQLEQGAHMLGGLEWYAVTPQVSSLKFRSPDCIKPLPKTKTLTSFFQPKKKDDNNKEKYSNNNEGSNQGVVHDESNKDVAKIATSAATSSLFTSSTTGITTSTTTVTPRKRTIASISSSPAAMTSNSIILSSAAAKTGISSSSSSARNKKIIMSSGSHSSPAAKKTKPVARPNNKKSNFAASSSKTTNAATIDSFFTKTK